MAVATVLDGEESCKHDRKRKLQTWVVLFALEVLKCVVVLMSSRPERHNCGAIANVSGICLIVHGFTIRHETNYQLASAKRDSLVAPSHLLMPAVTFVAYLEPELRLI